VSIPLKIEAGSELRTLDVTGKVHLTRQANSYIFNGIQVESAGSLLIDPGVSVLLAPGSQIVVNGSLKAVGTASAPVIFDALEPVLGWKSFRADENSQVSMHETEFHHFSQAVSIFSQSPTLDELSLIDGIDNRLILGEESINYPDISVDHLWFKNIQEGDQMTGSGLVFRGFHSRIDADELHFQDSRVEAIQNPGYLTVRIEGGYSQAYFPKIYFPSQCPAILNRFVLSKYFELIPDIAHCTAKLIPIVFVPGFGTSINMEKLSSTSLLPATASSRHFIKQLTPDYTVFLDTLNANHVPYEIAYYDWRLPADQIVLITYYLLSTEQRRNTGWIRLI
jgi:hypothetical protein